MKKIIIVATMLLSNLSHGATIKFRWDHDRNPIADGFRIYWWKQGTTTFTPMDVGAPYTPQPDDAFRYEITKTNTLWVEGQTFCFQATALRTVTSGTSESSKSNAICKLVPIGKASAPVDFGADVIP